MRWRRLSTIPSFQSVFKPRATETNVDFEHGGRRGIGYRIERGRSSVGIDHIVGTYVASAQA